MSNFGVVSTLSAPVLKGVTQPCVIQFDNAYKAYTEKVADVNRARDETDKIVPASIKNCVEPMLLSSLCTLGKIEGATKLEDTTDEMVEKWFNDRIKSTPRDLSERVRAAINSVSYKQCPEDPSGAALTFVVNIVKALEKQNAVCITTDKELSKGLILRMTEKLEPPELRERIKIAQECWTQEQKSSLTFFEERVGSTAEDVAEGEIARERLRLKSGTRKRDTDTANTIGRKRRHAISKDSQQDSKKEGTSHKKKAKVKCLNPEFGEFHLVKNCKITPPNLRKELLNEFFKSKEKPKNIKKLSSGEEKSLDTEHDGRYKVMVGEEVIFKALGDYGSDVNALSAQMLDKIIEKNQNVSVETLATPVELKVALKDNKCSQSVFTASRKVCLDVTIFLPETNIPVRIRGVRFIIADHEMDELILGRKFLHSIGFNLKDHLGKVHKEIHNQHIDELKLGEMSVSSLSYKGISYENSDDDPVGIDCIESISFGTDTDEEINHCISKIVDEAIQNGISASGARRLEIMLKKSRRVLRIKLGCDPPAKVAPLSLKLKHGAKPFKSLQRRYSPEHREFIIKTIRELESIGAVYKNTAARWASPALVVPKPGTGKLRLTVDLKVPNSMTIPIQAAMPHLESRLQDTQGSKCYANIDKAHAYWQLALDEESQEIHSIQTPIGVYTPTRILQGGTDSGNHYQAVTSEKFDEGGVHKI